MHKRFELHTRYSLRALAAASEFGTDSATYVANWKIVKSLEASNPTPFLTMLLEEARDQMETSQNSPLLKSYWTLQAIYFEQALQALNER